MLDGSKWIRLHGVSYTILLFFYAKYLHEIGPNRLRCRSQIRTVTRRATVHFPVARPGNSEVVNWLLFKWSLFIFLVLVFWYNKTNSDCYHRSSLKILSLDLRPPGNILRTSWIKFSMMTRDSMKSRKHENHGKKSPKQGKPWFSLNAVILRKCCVWPCCL